MGEAGEEEEEGWVGDEGPKRYLFTLLSMAVLTTLEEDGRRDEGRKGREGERE